MHKVKATVTYCPGGVFKYHGETITVRQKAIVFLTPESDREGTPSIRLFCDLGTYSKALYDLETNELHVPERAEGGDRLTFLRSFVSAVTRGAEGLGIVEPDSGAPSFELVACYASAANEEICVPPLDEGEVVEFVDACYADQL